MGEMAKEQYRVWSPDMGEDEDDCRLFIAYDHEAAATAYVERSYHEEAFDCEMAVMVRCTFGGDDGELKSFSVYPEPTIYFRAREITAALSEGEGNAVSG